MRNYSSTAVATELFSSITSSDTTATLKAATGLPSVPFTLVLAPDTANEEIVTVTARSGTSITAMSRGQESTTARSHSADTVVKHMVTGRDLQDAQDHIAASTGVHGVSGSVVGTSGSQTLTGKSISGSANSLSNIPQSAVVNLATDLSNKAASSHTHTLANVTDVTASASEVNILDGVTASTAELNILDGATLSTTELNYVDGVTSSIQTQLSGKASSSHTHAISDVTDLQTTLDGKVSTPGAWTSYTPVTKLNGVTLSNGSNTGYYSQVGKTVTVVVADSKYGSGTTATAETLTITLPVAAASTIAYGSGYVTFQSSDNVYHYFTATVVKSGTTSPIVTFMRNDVEQTYYSGSTTNSLYKIGSNLVNSSDFGKYFTITYQAA